MKRNKGFTLSELLVVVAIIGVLVAVSIPIFTAQLQKARIATNQANARAAYAAAMAAYMENPAVDPYKSSSPGIISFMYDCSTGTAVHVTEEGTDEASQKWVSQPRDYWTCGITVDGVTRESGVEALTTWDRNTTGANRTKICDKVYSVWKIDLYNGEEASSEGEVRAFCWQR